MFNGQNLPARCSSTSFQYKNLKLKQIDQTLIIINGWQESRSLSNDVIFEN